MNGKTDVKLKQWVANLGDLGEAANAGVSLVDLLDLIARTTSELMRYKYCALLLPDSDQNALQVRGSFGMPKQYIEDINRLATLDEHNTLASPSVQAFRSGRPVVISGFADDPYYLEWKSVTRTEGFGAMVIIPLMNVGVCHGTLNCYTRAPRAFADAEIELLTILANQAASAIAQAQLRTSEALKVERLKELNQDLAEQHRLLQQSDAIHQRLTEVALRKGGVTGVARALSDLIQRPIVVESHDGDILASAAYGGREAYLPSGFLPDPELFALDEEQLLFGQFIHVGNQVDSQVPGDLVVAGVQLDNEIVARIWIAIGENGLSDLDQRAIEHSVTVLALELFRRRTASEVEWRAPSEIVQSLITGDVAEFASITARAERLGHDLHRNHLVIVCRQSTQDHSKKLLSVVRSAAVQDGRQPLITSNVDSVVLLWPFDAGQPEVKELIDRVRSQYARYSDHALQIAVSKPMGNLLGYSAGFRATRNALELMRHWDTNTPTLVLGELGIPDLLLQTEDPRVLADFTERILGPLRAHDARRSTELEHTLRCYFKNNMNSAQTASDLFVHPNTIGLRLRKIEELVEASFSHVPSLAHMILAVMAEDALGLISGSGNEQHL